MSQNDIYARVVDGVVVEYPVYGIHIRHRAHPLDWYHKCILADKPEIPPFHYFTETIKYSVEENKVYVSYTVVPYTLQNLLDIIHQHNRPFDILATEPVEVKIEDVDPALVAKCVALFKEIAQKRLDDFALTREYDSIISLVSYVSSTNPQSVKEAVLGVALRDQTWDVYNAYMADIASGVKPVPKTVNEVVSLLPELTWGDI